MTPETRDKARRIADLAFGEADYGTVVDAIANAIFSAPPQPSGEVERMRQQLEEAREAHESLKELTIKRSTRMNAAESKALMLEAELWDAREALKPFANCVFSDNADVTINSSQLCAGDFLRAAMAISCDGQSALAHETDPKPHTPAE